jgi:metal-responsive CopG/Arc/MetJ family transcriptional regulator
VFGNSVKIKIDRQLWDRLARFSEMAGYASVDEFITHALEKEVAQIEESESDEEVREKLKGLGYIR